MAPGDVEVVVSDLEELIDTPVRGGSLDVAPIEDVVLGYRTKEL